MGYWHFLAYKKNAIAINTSKASTVNVQFKIRSTLSLDSILNRDLYWTSRILCGQSRHFFLLSLADIDLLGVYFDNIKNILVIENRNLVPLI